MAKTIKKMEVFQSNANPLLSDGPRFMIKKFECVGGRGLYSEVQVEQTFLGASGPCTERGWDQGGGVLYRGARARPCTEGAKALFSDPPSPQTDRQLKTLPP